MPGEPAAQVDALVMELQQRAPGNSGGLEGALQELLAEQLRAAQQLLAEHCQKASGLLARHERAVRQLEAENSELQMENERLRLKLGGSLGGHSETGGTGESSYIGSGLRAGCGQLLSGALGAGLASQAHGGAVEGSISAETAEPESPAERAQRGSLAVESVAPAGGPAEPDLPGTVRTCPGTSPGGGSEAATCGVADAGNHVKGWEAVPGAAGPGACVAGWTPVDDCRGFTGPVSPNHSEHQKAPNSNVSDDGLYGVIPSRVRVEARGGEGNPAGSSSTICKGRASKASGRKSMRKSMLQPHGYTGRGVFADANAMKERLKEAIGKREYNVHDFYRESGFWQRLARSPHFEQLTLGVIGLNALWMAVDTDYNKEAVLISAHPVFQVAENFFCAYFSFEWFARFMAFKNKRDCRKDGWFIFDSILVAMMVIETWLVSVVILITSSGGSSSSLGDASILRLFRLMRLSRMARMARLLRAMPELMVMIKAMAVAMRSMFFALCLLMAIVYVFSIAFTQIMADTAAGETYFKTVPAAMMSLLLHGTMPDQADMVTDVGQTTVVFKLCVLAYILIASWVVMNMLVGILCEVVSVVSSVEKEELLITYVKNELQEMMTQCGVDANGDKHISKQEFGMLLSNPESIRALQEVGVDVVGLVDFTDFIFEKGNDLSFADFMDMILQLRGTNTATVKDMVDLRKLVSTGFQRVMERLDSDRCETSCELTEASEKGDLPEVLSLGPLQPKGADLS